MACDCRSARSRGAERDRQPVRRVSLPHAAQQAVAAAWPRCRAGSAKRARHHRRGGRPHRKCVRARIRRPGPRRTPPHRWPPSPAVGHRGRSCPARVRSPPPRSSPARRLRPPCMIRAPPRSEGCVAKTSAPGCRRSARSAHDREKPRPAPAGTRHPNPRDTRTAAGSPVRPPGRASASSR